MTYSIDFRKKVLAIKEQEHLTFSAVSKRFGVGQASVVRWSQDIEPKRTRNQPTTKLHWETLVQDVKEPPDSYQYERAARVGVSPPGLADAFKPLKISPTNLPTLQSQSRSTTTLPGSDSPFSSNQSTDCL